MTESDSQNEANRNAAVAMLAGGLATRLGELSAGLPKSLIEVGGEPFLAHQLRGLASQGFQDVVLCAGHMGERIEAFAGDGSKFGCRVRYSFDGERLLGTGGALLKASPLLGERFIVIYGDSYLRAPILPIWKSFVDGKKAALMTVFCNEGRWDQSNVEFSQGEIRRYDKAAPPEKMAAMRHIDYGLGCIRRDALLAWAGNDRECFDLASFYRAMCAGGELQGFEVKERFYEIGSLAGLAETDALLSRRPEFVSLPE